ncbi:MAG: hypothetical protein NXI20_00770 [bacterium]|nr:hypothetical protein [bacterium]
MRFYKILTVFILILITIGFFLFQQATTCTVLSQGMSSEDFKRIATVFRRDLHLANVDTSCSEAGLQKVEEYLRGKSKEEQKGMIMHVGSYFGECVIESYGGVWSRHESGSWGIEISEGKFIFPINKVLKFVEEPNVDSFSSMYAMIPYIIELPEKTND